MLKKIIIVTSGGNSRDIVIDLLYQGFSVEGYIDKNFSNEFKDLKYLGDDSFKFENHKNSNFIITLGSAGDLKLRNKLYELYKMKLINFIHSTSYVSNYVSMARNSNIIVMMNSVIKANSFIGKNVFINSNSSIGHHVSIGDNSVISLGVMIGGNTKIGKNCFIGMGALIFENLSIKDNTVVRAGQIVNKNII